jgi:hypothetical protein
VKQCFHHGPIRAPAKKYPLTAPALIHHCRDLAHPPYAPGHPYLLFGASYFSNSLVFSSAHTSQASRTCSQPCRAAAVAISVTRAAHAPHAQARTAPHRTVAGIPASAQTLIPRTAPTHTCAHIITTNVTIAASLLFQTSPSAPCACHPPNSLGPLRPRETQTSCVPRLRRRRPRCSMSCMYVFFFPSISSTVRFPQRACGGAPGTCLRCTQARGVRGATVSQCSGRLPR